MKTLIAFIQKEFRHILRDKWTLLIIVGMPIAQLLLFGFAINTEVRDASVAVFDPVCDELTSRIVERIDASDYFNVTERITDIDRINDIFREGYTSLVIVFSDNFTNDILNGEASIQQIADDAVGAVDVPLGPGLPLPRRQQMLENWTAPLLIPDAAQAGEARRLQ